MKKTLIGFAIVHVLIFLTILIRGETLSLLSYINTSFVYGGILVFFGLWIFVIRTGVFDVFTLSMRKAFKRKSTLESDEMRAPSELIAFSGSSLLAIGTVTLAFMSVALIIYEI